ncbi:response regulator [bacterium]|nr:MAG: response regulator [bacterium]
MIRSEALLDGLLIMLVDDDENICDAFGNLFKKKGWKASVFLDPAKALDDLAVNRSIYSAIVVDINMPGISGTEFLKLARDIAPFVPVVMITGHPSINIAVDAMKNGAIDFLTKPFEFDELVSAVERAVTKAKAYNLENAPYPFMSDEIGGRVKFRLEDKIKELSVLKAISDTLDNAEEKDAIFNGTMELAKTITNGEKSLVMLVEHGSKELVVHATAGYEGLDIIGKRFSAQIEPFKSVIEGRSQLKLSAGADEVSRILSGYTREGTNRHNLMTLVPLIINREVMVVLGVAGSEGRMSLTTDASALLLSLTTKASLKLANHALTENIFSSIIGVISSLINAIDARDTYTKDHSHRVTEYAVALARTMGCLQEVTDSILFAGPLHDIGKIGVRDDILLKRGSLTDEENALMKSHVTRGEEILRPLNLFESEKAIVLYHHERWDGDGYPNGFHKDEIPMTARIFSVADTFDAMTTTRPYRHALSFDVAKQEIAKCGNTQFDPLVVEALLDSEDFRDRN